MKAPCGVEIKIGQKWREMDKRFDRTVFVVGFEHGLRRGHVADWVQIAPSVNLRMFATWARLWRFNGKSGGYKLEKDVA